MAHENLQTDLFLTAEIKIYYDLLLPENAVAPVPMLIAIHGYGGNKRAMLREAQSIAPDNFGIAVVQGFHQHWREPLEKDQPPKVGFSWLTSYKAEESVAVHHKILRDLIESLRADRIADKVFLLGFSQSCGLNFRFAFSNPELLSGIIGICGGVPGDWETSEIYQDLSAPVLYLYGSRDEFYPLEQFERNVERLKYRAVNLFWKRYEAAHEITDAMRGDVKSWLEKQ